MSKGMTKEEAKDVFLNRGFIEVENCRGRIFHADKWREACAVISEWLKEQPRWIPMVRREPTDEEKAEFLAQNGEELCYMLENEMPLNGQEVLVSIGEFVIEDVFDEDFYNFESNDIENVDAWMPKPKAYKAEMGIEE